LKTEHTTLIKESSLYKQIAAKMQEGSIMLARLHFVMSVADLFTPFLTKFQSESTSVHLLFKHRFSSCYFSDSWSYMHMHTTTLWRKPVSLAHRQLAYWRNCRQIRILDCIIA